MEVDLLDPAERLEVGACQEVGVVQAFLGEEACLGYLVGQRVG